MWSIQWEAGRQGKLQSLRCSSCRRKTRLGMVLRLVPLPELHLGMKNPAQALCHSKGYHTPVKCTPASVQYIPLHWNERRTQIGRLTSSGTYIWEGGEATISMHGTSIWLTIMILALLSLNLVLVSICYAFAISYSGRPEFADQQILAHGDASRYCELHAMWIMDQGPLDGQLHALRCQDSTTEICRILLKVQASYACRPGEFLH